MSEDVQYYIEKNYKPPISSYLTMASLSTSQSTSHTKRKRNPSKKKLENASESGINSIIAPLSAKLKSLKGKTDMEIANTDDEIGQIDIE
jgi:glutamyl-tRNA reductase